MHGEANLADALAKESAEAVTQDFFARHQRWSIVHDPDMRSAQKRKSDGKDRLQQRHPARKAWLYEWPEKPPTLAADAAECDLEEEPFGYLDSCQPRALLDGYLL